MISKTPFYDAVENIAARRAAARAMLAALKTAADAMQDALDGGEYWQENFAGSDIPTVRAAIAQAEAAGITVKED